MRILALNSGTSRDGVSAVFFQTQGDFQPGTRLKILALSESPYPDWMLKELNRVEEEAKLEAVARLNFLLGEFFAECALKLMKRHKIKLEQVDLIASHGQTIGHFPMLKKMGRYQIRGTLQIGEPSVIVNRTGITTVSDFRSGDIAAQGEGAPVLSYIEYLLFSSREKNRMALNLGGIANFSLLRKAGRAEEVRASDCGPCNILLDQLIEKLTKGKVKFDPGGGWALKGKPREKWIKVFLAHSFFKKPVPKTTGREEFNRAWLERVLGRINFRSGEEEELIRSGVCAVAEMIARCYFDWYSDFGLEEVVVSGGGAKNRALIFELEERLGKPVILSDRLGIPVKAKEPIGFGILAQLCLLGEPGNLPLATRAKARAVLGKISPGKNWFKILRDVKKRKGERG